MLARIHRVVTGHDETGKAIVSMDGGIPNVVVFESAPGMLFHEVWETRTSPALVDSGEDPTLGPLVHQAPANGTRIRFVDIPPDDTYLFGDIENAKRMFDEVNHATSFTSHEGSPHPAMHRTESIDYGIVIDGEITLVLDDSEVDLRVGSVVIQRGTNHAWSNRSSTICRMLFVQLDGQYTPELRGLLEGRLR